MYKYPHDLPASCVRLFYSLTSSSLQLTLEEVMTTTAYLDLFLRTVTEPALLQTFLSFVLLHQHEGVHILDTLVSRINTPFQVEYVIFTRLHTNRALKWSITHVFIVVEKNQSVSFEAATVAMVILKLESYCIACQQSSRSQYLNTVLYISASFQIC